MKFFTNKSGVVSIVALAIFAILAVFGLIISGIVGRSFDSVRSTNDYYMAQDLGEATIEFLEQELQRFGPGYNTPGGTITCSYNLEGADQNNPNYCDRFTAMAGDNQVTIEMEIKGRAANNENMNTERCRAGFRLRFNDSCYVAPLAATGNAGENCDIYSPAYGADGSSNMPEAIVGENEIDQLDYACNWSKLVLGSDLTSRVSIPLYYTDQNHQIVEPYQANQGGVEAFLLRMRTPCLPCVYGDQQAQEGISRHCERDQNSNVCTDDERYELDGEFGEDNDDILVQWQINGICEGGEDCGVVADIDDVDSQIYESIINSAVFENYIIMNNSSFASPQGNHNYNNTGDFIANVSSPKLSLFLAHPLNSSSNQNIPYLEYQLLTEAPIGNYETLVQTTVTLNNNRYEQESWIPIEVPLIDFAIQN